MIKIIGACIVVVCGVVYGLYMSNRETYKLDDLNEFKKAISMIQNNIKHFRVPLSYACIEASEKIKKPIADILYEFGTAIQLDEFVELDEVWAESVKKYENKMFVKGKELDLIYDFGKVVYSQNVEAWDTNINMLIQNVEDEIYEIRKSSVETKKMYRGLSIASSLLIVVICW